MTVERIARLLSPVTKNAGEYAKTLARKYPNFNAIAEAEIDELESVLSGDLSTSVYIKLTVALLSRKISDSFKFGKVYTDNEIQRYLVGLFFGLSVEKVYVLTLNSRGAVTSSARVSEGTVNFSNVLPRKVIEIAKKNNSKRVIIAHNHPGGYALPSEDDILSTRLLTELLSTSGIEIQAHYIVAGTECKRLCY